MATAARVDPFPNYNFFLEISGVTQAGFTECTGFSATIDPIEYREGNDNLNNTVKTARKLPGMTKFNNLTLKWGLTNSRELYDWFLAVSQGNNLDKNKLRRDGSIVVLDTDGKEAARWNFFKAWPTKWDGPDFNAKNSEVAIETLELVHEGIVRG